MRKLYEKKELLFALLWILAYCLVLAPIKGSFGYASPWMLLALLAFAAGIAAFVRSNHLERKYGLDAWPKDTRKYLYFLPMWILATGNLWDGFAPSYQGAAQLIAVLSMLLVGFVEVMLFRGFLFKALLKKEKVSTAIVITSLTFGMGHIVNLLAGQASLETFVQMLFAVAWGFILTMVCYKSGNLLPCIVAHAMIDVSAMFGADNPAVDAVCIGATIVVGTLYCLYLSRLKTEEQENESK